MGEGVVIMGVEAVEAMRQAVSGIPRITVLGTSYEVKFVDRPIEENEELYGGMCRPDEKVLEVFIGGRSTQEIQSRLTHELIHAYLFESGLTMQSYDETMVEWIARMLVRMTESKALADEIVVDRQGTKDIKDEE